GRQPGQCPEVRRRQQRHPVARSRGRLERAGYRDPRRLCDLCRSQREDRGRQGHRGRGSLSGMDTQAAGAVPPKFELFPSRQFPQWLAENTLSLAFTTHQAGKIICVGLQPTGRLSIFERTFNRCMGLWSNGQSLWMSTLYQLWRFENVLGPGEQHDGYDRVYVPALAYTTGDLDIHDVALDAEGQPVFANTLFCCLATVSEGKSFRPLWRAALCFKMVAGGRCRLNGLAGR